MTTYLGIDVGHKRVGLAVSDVNASVASPLETLEDASWSEMAATIVERIEARDVDALVVGWPLRLDGTEGRSVDMVRRFESALRTALEERDLEIPIERWDERMTSQGAEQVLIDADMSRRKRRPVIDRVAAAKILQNYLDSLDS
jgi:putative Holliday junction resolvase